MTRTGNVISLQAARRERINARLLAAAKAVQVILDSMPLNDLMEGKDEPARAELAAAIQEAEANT